MERKKKKKKPEREVPNLAPFLTSAQLSNHGQKVDVNVFWKVGEKVEQTLTLKL